MLSIYESTLGATRAFITGLGGSLLGGGISGAYDRSKAEAAEKALALKSGNPQEYYDADSTGKKMLYSLGGSIPVIGAFTNLKAYDKRMEAEERLRHALLGRQ